MKRPLSFLFLAMILIGCISPSITGPSSFNEPPRYGWTMAEVRAHWGPPYRTSWYESGTHGYDTWVYRRSFFVTGLYGNTIEAEYASVSFIDGKVVGVSY